MEIYTSITEILNLSLYHNETKLLKKSFFKRSSKRPLKNKTKDWALVQNVALADVGVRLG